MLAGRCYSVTLVMGCALHQFDLCNTAKIRLKYRPAIGELAKTLRARGLGDKLSPIVSVRYEGLEFKIPPPQPSASFNIII